MRRVPFLLLCLLPAQAIAAHLTVERAIVVGRSGPDATWTDAATEARAGDGAELAVVLQVRDGKRVVFVADDEVAPLSIKRKKVPASRRRGWDAVGAAEVRWSYVEPHGFRPDGEEAANGAGTPYYSNVRTGGAHHGEWLGYDSISYFATPVGDFDGDAAARRRAATANPPRAEDDVYGGLGTMRYQVEVRIGGETFASPGAEDVDTFGILPAVHRVTIRSDDSILGRLTGYFMVPEVFGSAGNGRNNQTERYDGADCADVLVGAVRAAGYSKVWYSHVAGLTSYAKVVVDPLELDDQGMPDEDITDARVGDIIRIDYGGAWGNDTPRAWDHVAVWYEDKSDPKGAEKGGPDGKLDGFDLVVHMGHPHLVVERLSEQAPAKIDILRWDEKKIGKQK